MIKKLFVVVLVFTFIGTPFISVHAEEKQAPLETQLTELREYVTRLTEAGKRTPLSDNELRTSITLGTKWLMRTQEQNGHFRYEYHPFEDFYSNDDNIVRQTGALYAQSEVLMHDKKNTLRVASTVARAIAYFEHISKESAYGGITFRCVTKHASSKSCELGATALALVGVLNYLEYAPDERGTYESLVRDYRAFILAMQKEEGGFRNHFTIGRSSQSDTESPYSNGEALLALTRLELYEHDQTVRASIERALAYLVTLPYDNALYLWIMAALKDVREIDASLIDIEYVRGFTEARIAAGTRARSAARNFCAYTEGVVSALTVLKEKVSTETFDAMVREADLGLRMNRNLQLTENDMTRAFIKDSRLTLSSIDIPKGAVGGFLTGEAGGERVLRIDFTQHCVSAYLQMLTDVRRSAFLP